MLLLLFFCFSEEEQQMQEDYNFLGNASTHPEVLDLTVETYQPPPSSHIMQDGGRGGKDWERTYDQPEGGFTPLTT